MSRRWSLVERTVRVVGDRGKDAKGQRYVNGSGCLIGGTTVLTAAHVVAGAERVDVRRADLKEKAHPALFDQRFGGDPRQWELKKKFGPDIALLTVEDAAGWKVPPILLARVNRNHPSGQVNGARSEGYPVCGTRNAEPLTQDKDQQQPASDRGPVWTQVPVAGSVMLSDREDGLLNLQVVQAPQELTGASPWEGISGAAVIASGYLIGVITEHATKLGSSTLAMTPLTAIDPDPEHEWWRTGVTDPAAWWVKLGVTGRHDLTVLPKRLRDYFPSRLVKKCGVLGLVAAVLVLSAVLVMVLSRGATVKPAPFPVSVVHKYDPSGFMGDTADFTVTSLDDASTIRFEYSTKGNGPHEWDLKYVDGKINAQLALFGGVMMLNPANNFGTDPNGGWDLRGARRITWRACSGQNDVVVKFMAGGAAWTWDAKTGTRVWSEYPDSLPAGVVELTQKVSAKCDQGQYQSFEISLANVPDDQLRRVVCGFSWLVNWSDNGVVLNEERTGPKDPKQLILQVRDIQYEKS